VNKLVWALHYRSTATSRATVEYVC